MIFSPKIRSVTNAIVMRKPLFMRVFMTISAAILLSLTVSSSAFASEESPVVEVQSVQASLLGASESVDVADQSSVLKVSRIAPLELNAACSPDVIQAGVDCGMESMCGIEPCLCGSADAWGGCSCNGLVDVYPDVEFSSSNEGIVRILQAFDRTWIIPVAAGKAQISIAPSLRYHTSQVAVINVEVSGLQTADFWLGAVMLACLVIICGVCAAVILAVKKRKARGLR
jgi:hypothetical protein